MDARASLKAAADMGADGVQLWNAGGELDPQALDRTARADLKNYLAQLGLTLSALCADFGGHGFATTEKLEWRIERTKEVVDLAVHLGTTVITTHIGLIPEDPKHPTWRTMQTALEEVGSYAERKGCTLATETGPEAPELMARFLDTLKTRGVTVNYDPANLLMSGFDHIAGVHILARYIVHTHAKDGARDASGRPHETPLWQGQVDFPAHLAALKQVGYDGFLTIEREAGDDPARDVAAAVRFLKGLLGR